jgi:hypothetical protein
MGPNLVVELLRMLDKGRMPQNKEISSIPPQNSLRRRSPVKKKIEASSSTE